MDFSLAHSIASMATPWAALIAIGLPTILALGVGYVMFAIFTPQEFAEAAVVGSVKFGFVVEIYAVVAALSLVGSWDIYQTARDNLQKETSALYMVAHSVDVYNLQEQSEARDRMRVSIRDYASSVIVTDWPWMARGHASRGSDEAFTRMTRAFFDAEPVTLAQQAVAQNVPQWMAQIAEARISRLSVVTRTLSLLIWVLVLTVSVAVLFFQWFIGSSNQGMHYAMGGVISIIVGSVILVSLKLAFPFVGDNPLLSSRPFYQLLEIS